MSEKLNKRLTTKEELQLELFDEAVGFIEFDKLGKVVHANDKALTIFGYSSNDSINLNHSDFVPKPKRKNSWIKLLAGSRNSGEFLRLKKDGTFVWIKAKYKLIQQGGEVENVYQIITDISDHKSSQLQLSQQHATLHKAAIVSETDAEGKITFVNEQFCEVSKYSESELIGSKHNIIKSNIQPEKIYRELWETISSGNLWQGILCNRNKEGGFYWEYLTISPFRNLQGEIYKHVSIGFDISAQVTQKIALKQRTTALKKKHQDLEKINAQLDKAYQHKTEFLANMSHELRTPLNAILLLSRLLMENSEKHLTEEEVEFASIINSSGNSLLELINDVLDASKFEAGRMEANNAAFSLNKLLEPINATFSRISAEKQLSYTCLKHSEVPDRCFGDELKIQQVLKNLLSNAIKFTETGYVNLTIDVQKQAGINYVRFIVEDTGIGISEENQETIFTAFRQVDGSSSRKFKGTGLGLSISSKITSLLEGTLTLDSTLGKGSRFTLMLPIIADVNLNTTINNGKETNYSHSR